MCVDIVLFFCGINDDDAEDDHDRDDADDP